MRRPTPQCGRLSRVDPAPLSAPPAELAYIEEPHPGKAGLGHSDLPWARIGEQVDQRDVAVTANRYTQLDRRIDNAPGGEGGAGAEERPGGRDPKVPASEGPARPNG